MRSPWDEGPNKIGAAQEKEKHDRAFRFLTEKTVIFVLAFVGGFVDSTGYVKLDGLFTASISGNLVVASTSIYKKTDGIVARSFVTAAFTFAAAFSVILILRLKLVRFWTKKSVAKLLFTIEALLLLVSIPIGIMNADAIAADGAVFGWPLILMGSILGGAMGLHNAASKEYIPNCPATTVMTMTLISVAISWAQMVVYSGAHYLGCFVIPSLNSTHDPTIAVMKAQTSIKNFRTVVKPFIMFIIGAICGVVVTTHASYWSIFVPVALICWIVVDIHLSDWDVELPSSVISDDGKDDNNVELTSRSTFHTCQSPVRIPPMDDVASMMSDMEIGQRSRSSTLYDNADEPQLQMYQFNETTVDINIVPEGVDENV